MQIKSLVIAGDSGKDYTVTVGANGRAHCTCPAHRFAYTESCKHIEFALASFAVAH